MDTLNLDYGVKTENRGKLDTKTDLEYGEKTENVENEKCALYALEYWEKAEKRGK
ncbi:hypothetical protein T4D_1144 [Trichinella pseudospiralis]|uniref:Uncharacterized protein n=2 Tax=Trichinella TaxID=6333 RepID=A0A0V1ERR6_TRIPS|nr:hypothetical protein T4D_1144 [Trichinella pseudospiralis]